MNCDDYRQLLNQRLDSPGGENASWESHALSCDECARFAVGFRVLQRAIALSGRPAVSADFVDRVLAARARGLAEARTARRRSLVWAVSITGLAASTLIAWNLLPPRVSGEKEIASPVAARESRSLAFSLATATSAGLDLARETSAPAARVSLGVLDAARETGDLRPSSAESTRAGDVLQSVGQRLGDEVRPLSGSARRAFSFLALPASDSDAKPNRPGA